MEKTADNTLTLALDAASGTARISIEHVSGDVEVSGWDRQEVEVYSSDADGDTGIEDLFEMRQNGNEVEIRSAHSGGDIGRKIKFGKEFDLGGMIRIAIGAGLSVSADLKVKVPHNSDLRVRTANGEIEVRDVDGRISIASASGDVDLSSVAGNVMVKTASGDVEITDFAGRLGVRTMSGDLEVRAGELLDLQIGTASGDVDVSGKLVADGEYELQSVSGDVTLSLPGDTQARAELRTISGDIRCRLPHESQKQGRRNQQLTINGGDGPVLRFSSTSGDILIREWAGEPQGKGERPAATQRLGQIGEGVLARVEGGDEERGNTVRLNAAEAPQEPKLSQMEILDAIERGEMSVEEGLRRMGQ